MPDSPPPETEENEFFKEDEFEKPAQIEIPAAEVGEGVNVGDNVEGGETEQVDGEPLPNTGEPGESGEPEEPGESGDPVEPENVKNNEEMAEGEAVTELAETQPETDDGETPTNETVPGADDDDDVVIPLRVKSDLTNNASPVLNPRGHSASSVKINTDENETIVDNQ